MSSNTDVAIIGLSGRYSGAKTPDILWDKLKSGEDLNIKVSKEKADKNINNPNYVDRCPNMDDIDCFDNELFNYSPYEAMITDPQQRIFLECCFHALEDAGYAQDSKNKSIGVFGSTSLSSYFINNIMRNRKYADRNMFYNLIIGNDKDFLATRVSYKLNLAGPAITIQCACSGSLVALNYAYQSVLNYECDAALVGGVSITIPQNVGYFYQKGMIFSKDGYCRPFDDSSSGTIKGNGCSVILIKRLEDAKRDNDHIYAVIKGTAVNNDASNKIGFTAPSVEGQTDAIDNCLSFADISPSQIDYIEAHGTGTRLGDPIEFRALSNVFRNVKNSIPVGSIKANVGHLDCAAGTTSLIKCIYMLRDGIIPPNIYFNTLNTEINNSNDLFYFPNTLEKKHMEYIGISSFGIGGTNAHAVISAYHAAKRETKELPCYVLPISFLRNSDFDEIKSRLVDALQAGVCLQDLIYTMSVGKKRFLENTFITFRNNQELIEKLKTASGNSIKNNTIIIPSFTLSNYRAFAGYLPLYKTCFEAQRDKITDENSEIIYARFALIQFLDTIGAIDSTFAKTNNGVDSLLMRKLSDSSIKTEINQSLLPFSGGSQTSETAFELLFEYIGKMSLNKSISFDLLYAGLNWGRISLPQYPLAKNRFWIDPDTEASQPSVQEAAATVADKVEENVTTQVIKIWEDVLNSQSIHSNDDFYDVGGDSLLAISILRKINTRFSINLDLKELLNCTTPSEVGELIQNHSPKAPAPSFISKVREAKNSHINIFLAHPAGGTVFCYKALNRYLTCDANIYALSLPENFSTYQTMEELAAFYRDEILKIQSDGNYYLGGYSFGGNLAFEIALQMQKLNKNVAGVVMFDSLPPDSYCSDRNITIDYEKVLPYVFISYMAASEKTDALKKADFENKSMREILQILNSTDTGIKIQESDLSYFFDKWVYNHELLRFHKPLEKLKFNIEMFDCKQTNGNEVSEPLHVTFREKSLWKKYINGELNVHYAAGNHFTMFSSKNNLRSLAADFNVIASGWIQKENALFTL